MSNGPIVHGGTRLPRGLVSSPATRTVAAVQAKLANKPAGVSCFLQGKADLPIGLWVANGAGESSCDDVKWDRSNGTEYTQGDADTFDIELDTGSSIDWTDGLDPAPGVMTKIIPHCMGIRDAQYTGAFFSRYAQSNPGAALVDGVFFGVGAFLPRAGTPLVALSVIHYLTVGGWSSKIGLNLWPSITFFGGVPITNDATGEVNSFRSPRGDGTDIQCSSAASQNGDTTGPLQGVMPSISALTDGWSFDNELTPGMFYDPKTSGQIVSFKDFRVLHGGQGL